MAIFTRIVLICLLTATALRVSATELPDWNVPKKIIYFGWGDLTASFLKDNIGDMGKKSPFDGVGILLRGQGEINGKNVTVLSRHIFINQKWKYEWFANDVKILKEVKSTQFTDNFLRASTLPGNIDWFDDNGWEAVTNNFAILARIARETGCKGIQYDPEYYPNPVPEYCNVKIGQPQFQYNPDCGKSFDECWAKARERGHQLLTAVGKEFPQIKILMFYGVSECYRKNSYTNPYPLLRSHVSGLYLPFLNGMYDAMTPEMTFIDGSEWDGYMSKDPICYNTAVVRFHKMARLLVDKKNHNKLGQTQFAPAFYMDAYFPPTSKLSYDVLPDKPIDDIKPRLAALETNLESALDVCDEYVWVWGEQGRWWGDEKYLKFKSWEEKAPGITQAMLRAKQQLAYAEKKVIEAKLPNLLTNGDFEKTVLGVQQLSTSAPLDVRKSEILNWGIWQQKPPQGVDYGTFKLVQGKGYQNSTAVLASDFVNFGCLVSFTRVIPGKHYLIRGKMLSEGNGAASLSITWRTGTPPVWYRNDALAPDLTIAPEPIKDSEWKRFAVVVRVADNVTELGIQPSVIPQKQKADKVYFDDFEIYQLD